MIRLTSAAAAVAAAASLAIACRDAPPTAVEPAEAPALALGDSSSLPGPAQIRSAYTEIKFYDGRNGGEPLVEFHVGMEYYGNRASMATHYTITGEGVSLADVITNFQDSFYLPLLRKDWHEIYYVPPGRNCGIRATAYTNHYAWWLVWLRLIPSWESSRVFRYTSAQPLEVDPCPPESPAGPAPGAGGGGGSHSYWVVIETCYYWAHYVDDVLVSIELRYCESESIPIAEE